MTNTPSAPPLRVGVDLAPPAPMCFGLPGDPDFSGFEVDLLHALGLRLGREVRAEAWLWSDMLEKLNARTLDLICTAATITPEREQRFLFSEPYLDTGLVTICRQAQPVADLARDARRVGARISTPAACAARDAGFRDVTTFHYNDEAYRALEEGTVDAVVDDWPIGAWFASQSSALAVGARLPGTEAQYAFVLRHDDCGLKTEVDAALRAFFTDGTYAAAYAQWMFPSVGDTCDVTRASRGR